MKTAIELLSERINACVSDLALLKAMPPVVITADEAHHIKPMRGCSTAEAMMQPISRPVPRMSDNIYTPKARIVFTMLRPSKEPMWDARQGATQHAAPLRGRTAAEVARDYAKTQALVPERVAMNGENVEYARALLEKYGARVAVTVDTEKLRALTAQAANWVNRHKPGAFQ